MAEADLSTTELANAKAGLDAIINPFFQFTGKGEIIFVNAAAIAIMEAHNISVASLQGKSRPSIDKLFGSIFGIRPILTYLLERGAINQLDSTEQELVGFSNQGDDTPVSLVQPIGTLVHTADDPADKVFQCQIREIDAMKAATADWKNIIERWDSEDEISKLDILHDCISSDTLVNPVKTSLLVGTALNFINNGDVITQYSNIGVENAVRIISTFLVPFIVALYSRSQKSYEKRMQEARWLLRAKVRKLELTKQNNT